MTKGILLAGCVSLSPLPLCGGAVYAQSTELDETQSSTSEDFTLEPDGTFAPDEIVVTAQGRTQRLQDVPISASVASGEALQKADITNLESLSVRLPNFRIATASISDFVTVRGVGSSLNLGFEQSVGTFVDGVYRGRSRTTRSGLFDLERVELLKGPQTTFFGNNTIAGAINITTRKPGKRVAANSQISFVPETEQVTAEAGFSLPLSETLAIRLAGRVTDGQGYIKNTNTGREGPAENRMIGRASVAWQPIDAIEIDARIDVGRNRDNAVANYELVGCPPEPAFGPPAAGCARYLAASGGAIDDVLDQRSEANRSYFDYDFVEAATTARIALGDHTLSSITGYFHHDYDTLYDPVPIPATRGGSVVGTTQTVATRIGERYEQFSQELRIASDDSKDISYIAGAYYQTSKLEVDQFIGLFFAPFGAFTGGLVAPTTPVATRVGVGERTDVYSAFGAATARLGPTFRINAGLRYSKVEKRDDRTSAVGATASLPSITNFVPLPTTAQAILSAITGLDVGDFAQGSRGDDRLLPSVSVQFDATPDVMAYVSYAKGFKAGGFSIGTSAASFGPETVDAYEVGIKSSLFDRLLTLNLAGFYSEYSQLQETSTIILPGSGAARQIVANVASTVAKGIELNATLMPIDGLTLSTDVAYLSSKYQDYFNGPCTSLQAATIPQCVQDLSGKDRAFAPKFSGNVGANYTTLLHSSLRLGLDANLYFSSRFLQQPTADPRIAQPGYAKLDARISLGGEDGRWEVALVGKNLTDKLTASYRQIVPSAVGSIAALADPPRTVGVQLTFRQ